MTSKRKYGDVNGAAEEIVDPSDELIFTCLGGGNEVGRSCHIIQYKGKTIMLDAGMHPAYDGFASLPFFDEFDLSSIDVLLISHFHVDHAAALPYVLSKTGFQGKVFMTYATRAIYKWLIQDTLRVGNLTSSAEQNITLYTEADHLTTFPKIEPIDFYTTHTVSSIRITPYPAGHVLGAAMYLIDIAGLKILFTGDYSREEDRHLVKASIPKDIKVDVLICESTFGTALHIPRHEREIALMRGITSILDRGGRALLPVFALGTAQELLLILEEYWSKHPKYQKHPIYYASNLARRCMLVYQTYISAMNDNIKSLFARKLAEAERSGKSTEGIGPWDFQFIRALKSLERFEDVGPCVMLASPGMMQNGASRELLEKWAPHEQNGVIITGYSVEGTMAQSLLHEPESFPAVMTKKREATGQNNEISRVNRRCTIQETSFAAHVDGQQNREFVEEVNPEIVILVHGSKHNMIRFKSKLLSTNADREKRGEKPFKVYSPANTDEIKIPFKRDKFAKVVGRLAQIPPPEFTPNQGNGQSTLADSRIVSGVLVQNGFNLTLMAPEDLKEYAGLTTTTITFKKRLICSAGIDLIRWGLEGMFGGIKQLQSSDEQTTTLLIMDSVTIYVQNNGEVLIEWEGNAMNDSIADAVLSILLQMETSAAGVKRSTSPAHSHPAPGLTNPHKTTTSSSEKLSRLLLLLENQFGDDAVAPVPPPSSPSPSASPMTSAPATPAPPAEDGGDSFIPQLEISVPPHTARVSLRDLSVDCKNAGLKSRIQAIVERACETVASMSVD